jgi:hypothetical protein
LHFPASHSVLFDAMMNLQPSSVHWMQTLDEDKPAEMAFSSSSRLLMLLMLMLLKTDI